MISLTISIHQTYSLSPDSIRLLLYVYEWFCGHENLINFSSHCRFMAWTDALQLARFRRCSHNFITTKIRDSVAVNMNNTASTNDVESSLHSFMQDRPHRHARRVSETEMLFQLVKVLSRDGIRYWFGLLSFPHFIISIYHCDCDARNRDDVRDQ